MIEIMKQVMIMLEQSGVMISRKDKYWTGAMGTPLEMLDVRGPKIRDRYRHSLIFLLFHCFLFQASRSLIDFTP